MHKPIQLPIHFKTPGRSYSQIGRKGNIALYSVYSDYLAIPNFALPYLLVGYELIVIKVKNGRECYPASWQFGQLAWSIPKSFSRLCSACFRGCLYVHRKLCLSKFKTVPNRSTASEASAHMAQHQSPQDQTPSETATNAPQRRVSLR